MAGITGIGSGLDINNIVKAMVEAETAPKAAQLSRLEKTTTTKISALGSLKGALSNFQTTMKDLNKMSLFENRTAVSSNTSALTASASKTALSGSYSVAVQQLASSSKVATAALAKDFSADAAGTLTVSLGSDDESPVTVNVENGASLIEIRDALNAQLKDKGISANIVNNPSTKQPQLVLSAEATGDGKDISIVGAGGNLSDLNIDGASAPTIGVGGYLEKASNAKFTIDGLALESASNTIDDAIPDVSFTLKGKTEENKPLTVTVGQDNSGVKSQLQKFVDSYNELIKVTSELTGVTKVGDDKAPVVGGLVGDSTVRTLLSGMRNELTNASGVEGLQVLADLGITTQKDGTLKIDDEKLGKALESNFDAVAQFVAGDNGLMTRMDKRINGYVETGGVLEQRIKGYTETTTKIDTQREALIRRSGTIEARLFKQFNAMDALVSQLNNTSASLLQSLENLPGFVRKDK
ncbi:flagellar filament capping protein FliD [Denitrificimonas caeni]|uniref:flagellar filament capping protein FliD n=1 Tax=Denitrificimonas caeni TaxID=521720 RepID=UPI0003B40626|nr:flagellar filament capping protein FliD [Denitrificimonas caeni]